MSKQPFSGIYAQHLKEFVALKQSLGYKYTRASVCLDDFDRFTQTRGEHTLGISRELSEAFCAKRPYESNSTRILRVSTLRVFSAYLCNLGIRSFIPPPCICGRGAYIPYVFSRDEIKKVFAACDTLVSGRKYKHLNLFVMPALLRFLYATGCTSLSQSQQPVQGYEWQMNASASVCVVLRISLGTGWRHLAESF